MFVTIIKSFIKLYSWTISPLLGTNCRYAPSCSEYSQIAFERYGVIKGGLLTIKRLARCHPWGGHGYDPVPEKVQSDKKDDKST